jgi:hypothetical protein
LGERGVKEGMIKNELPPFMLLPEEAMKIATSGYDLDEAGLRDEESISTRKRAITMRNGGSPNTKTIPGVSRNIGTGFGTSSTSSSRGTNNGLSKSSSGLGIGIGIGQPSQNQSLLSSSTNSRSSSSKTPTSTPTPTTTSQTRSASLNMLASSPTTSRLAHLVPPDQTYKPPKGVNWDEVVIPTVAKRLAAGQGSHDVQDYQEGDLAVEWDKDGTPVKWVKWNGGSVSPRLDTSVNSNSNVRCSVLIIFTLTLTWSVA